MKLNFIKKFRKQTFNESPACIPISDCSTWLGFSLSDQGWHPFRQVVEELINDDRITYRSSSLCLFYNQFQPHFLADAFGLDLSDQGFAATTPANTYIQFNPWSDELKPMRNQECQHFGPAPNLGPKNFFVLKDLLGSIQKHGFNPHLASDSICGIWLVDYTGRRFIIRGGQHRCAVLAALGHTTVPARVTATVYLRDAASWPLVRDGVLSIEEAVTVAQGYFLLSGVERQPKKPTPQAIT